MARNSRSGRKAITIKKMVGKKKKAVQSKAGTVAKISKKMTAAPRGKRFFGLTGRTNRAILDECIGATWPRDRKLDPPYSRYALAGLAAQIKQQGVPVQTAQIQMCDTVGCVLDLMKKANPGGR